MKKITTILGVLMMILASCSDFLDPESKSEYIPEDVTSLNTLLIGYEEGHISSLLEMLDDDVACQPLSLADNNNWSKAFEMYTWQPNYWYRLGSISGDDVSDYLYNAWFNAYKVILRVNAVLDYISEVSGTSDMRNYVEGQALGIRAYYHFLLVNIFGVPYSYDPNGLGVVVKLSSAVEPGGIARATVQETYDQILKDLLEAERNLENTSEVNAYNMNYRMNLPTVWMILSRVYLYMENWGKAAEYASKVIECNKLSMLNFNDIETLFGSLYSHPDFHNYQNPEVMWVYDIHGTPVFRGTFRSQDINNVTYNTSWFRASDELVALYDQNDLRIQRYLFKDSLDMKNGTLYYYYRPLAKCALTNAGTIRNGDIFFASIRLVEAYLNRAEASAMLFEQGEGDMQTVLNDIKLIHSYRYKTGTISDLQASNAGELIQLVRDERRREFCFENTRWFDLRRYGMPEIKHLWQESGDQSTWKVYTLTEEDKGYTLPIPDKALEQNPKLKQNPLASRREN